MRIISGKWGGRRIQPPSDMPQTRPTTDVAKEGLFNILSNNLDFTGLHTLDIFGGTGCISYELASRGVTNLTIVEKDPEMHAFITRTFAMLGFPEARVIRQEVFAFLDQDKDRYDLIFAGPPYALREINELPDLVFEKKLLNEGGWFVLEHTPRNDFKGHPYFRAERKYGTTLFSIFVNREKA
jgi:16S rRNA (guanine966-N2)-methyltransferase